MDFFGGAGRPIEWELSTPYVLLIAFAAGAVPYSNLLDPYFPGFIPPVLVPALEASAGALAGLTLLDVSNLKSFDKKWRERFLLAAFMGALAGTMLGQPILGYDNKATDCLAASVAILGTFVSPYHLIRD